MPQSVFCVRKTVRAFQARRACASGTRVGTQHNWPHGMVSLTLLLQFSRNYSISFAGFRLRLAYKETRDIPLASAELTSQSCNSYSFDMAFSKLIAFLTASMLVSQLPAASAYWIFGGTRPLVTTR